MRSIRRILPFIFVALAPSQLVAAPYDKWRQPAADTIAWFETSGGGYGKITPDFDCMGVSVGVLQWNVGKGSLWESIVKPLDPEIVRRTMPTFGVTFRDALLRSKEAALAYVRQFQAYRDAKTCNGNLRGASWKAGEGQAFVRELKQLLTSPDAIEIQRKALQRKLAAGWSYGAQWAAAKRGAGAEPTYREFVTFTDTLNFNGRFESVNYTAVKQWRQGKTDRQALSIILEYLKNEQTGQYQKREATKNAELWATADINEEKIDLLSYAYLVAQKISKESAVPFKLNTISRRGTIIFGTGYVNGPQQPVSFSIPND